MLQQQSGKYDVAERRQSAVMCLPLWLIQASCYRQSDCRPLCTLVKQECMAAMQRLMSRSFCVTHGLAAAGTEQLALARLSSKANSACRSRCTRWRRFCSSLEAEVDAASIARC